MTIRTFQSGDESAQISIYNEVAGSLPGFKPALSEEVRRRQKSKSYDANLRFFALENDAPVGYATLSRNGRVSYPWCKPGFEKWQKPLFENVERAARELNLRRIYAAYRSDWLIVREFLVTHGFEHVRDMVNFVLNVTDLPTLTVHAGLPERSFRREDLPSLKAMGGGALRDMEMSDLERYYLANPHFPAESLFVLRARASNEPLACGIFVQDASFADPRKVDAAMPCFRLGAFGNEREDVKRIHGMFSFVTKPGQNVTSLGLDLLGHAVQRMNEDVDVIAAQVASDSTEMLEFYSRFFRRQGSFPVFERTLS